MARGGPLMLFDQVSKHCWWRGCIPSIPKGGTAPAGQAHQLLIEHPLPQLEVLPMYWSSSTAIQSTIILSRKISLLFTILVT